MAKTKFNTEKAINAILFISTRLGAPADVYASLKAIYFADRYHLEQYGRQIYGEVYTAMEHGPVPSGAYDIVKLVGGRASLPVIAPGASDAMSVDKFKITPKHEADLDLFSRSDLICLELGIERVRGKSFSQIKDDSHGQAYNKADLNGDMSLEDIVAELTSAEFLAPHLEDRFPGVANSH
jgi:uncharacterized phage-associated protein